MAIALVGTAATGNSGTAQPASIPITFDPGAQAGHVAVIVLHTAPGAATVTDPTGWTVHANGDGGNTKIGIWSKVLTAGDLAGVTITRSVGSSYSWEAPVYSGTTGVDAVSAQQATTTGTTSPFFPAVTPVAANCLRLGVCAGRVVTAATTASQTSPPASWAPVGQAIDAHATNQRRLSFVDSIQLVGQAGVAQGTATATTDQSVTYQSYSLTLAPVTVVTVTPATISVPVSMGPVTAVGTNPTIAGFGQGFTKPAPFGVATVVPPPPTPPAPSAEVAGALPSPVLQLGFSTDPLVGGGSYAHWSDPERGTWDTLGVWAPDEVWTDVTPWLIDCSWQRGATRVEGPILRYEPGTLSAALVNDDGRFHPANLAGPYVSAGRSQVRPMLPARLGVLREGTVYWQWRGFVEGFAIAYPAPDHSVASFTATDAQMVLSSVTRAAGPAVGAGESAGARVRRVLTSAGWPTTDRRVDNGETPLQATTLEGDPWAELLLVQDTELGEIYVDAVGKVVFKGRHAILTETLSTVSQAVFGAWAQPGELPHESKVYDAGSVSDIRNVHRITRAGGIATEARDEASVKEFLEHTHERTDLLMQTDTEAADYGRYLLALSKDPADTFTEIVVDPRAHPDVWTQVLTRDFGDRITIRSRPPGVRMVSVATGIGLNNTGPEKGAIPGTYGVDYRYDSQATLTYLAGLGCPFVRVMVRWERIQPTLSGALDATELGRLKSYLGRVAVAGMHAVLVINKGARYNELALGEAGGPTQADFVDLWSRLAAEFATDDTVRSLDNNEPHDLPDSFASYANVATFDVDTQGWTSEAGSGVTTARSTATVHDGSGSLSAQKTVAGGSFQSLRVTDNNTVTHDESAGGYDYACWVFCPAGETGWFAQIDITNAAGANIAGTPQALTPNAWTYVSDTFTTAQVSAMQRKIVQIHNAAPTAGSKTFFIDSIVQAIRYTGRQRWQDADRAAYEAAVAAGFTGAGRSWTAAGYAWSAASGYATTNGAPWITASPLLAVRYGAHSYYDNDHSGTYTSSYATENANAVAQGYASVTARALAWTQDFLTWLGTYGVTGFLGETGWPDTDSAAWNPVGAAVLDAATAAGASAAVWAVGEIEGTGYPLTPWEASGGVGTPVNTPNVQASVVGPRLGGDTVSAGQGIIERDVYIRGIAGQYGGTNRWRWTWALQPAQQFNFGIWGAGSWGVSVWAY